MFDPRKPNAVRDYLLRALISTLEGQTPEQFAEQELARTREPIDAQAVMDSLTKRLAQQSDCGLAYDEVTGRIIRRW